MERIEAGMLAVSKAGHDKGSLYLVVKAEGEFVYLCDGRLRPLAKPKKKRCRHIQIIHRMQQSWNPEQIRDDDIKRAVRQYKQSLQA